MQDYANITRKRISVTRKAKPTRRSARPRPRTARGTLLVACRRKASVLLFSALAIGACIPLLVWLTRTFPTAPLSSCDIAIELGMLASVAKTVSLAALLSFLHVLLSDNECASLASAEAALVSLGVHLMPHFLSYGLGTVAALSLVTAFSLMVELAYGCPPRSVLTFVLRPLWWSMLSLSLCSCLTFALSITGLLPYASGLPKLVPDHERGLAQNMETVRSLYDMEDWEVSCAEGARLIQTVVMVEARYLGIPPEEEPVVEMAPLVNPATVAHYDHSRNTIVFSPYALRRAGKYAGPYAIYVASHEMAHAWQHRAIEDSSILEDTKMPVEVDEDRIDIWAHEFRNYISGAHGTEADYANQDCEMFANEYALIAFASFASSLQQP